MSDSRKYWSVQYVTPLGCRGTVYRHIYENAVDAYDRFAKRGSLVRLVEHDGHRIEILKEIAHV